MGSEKSTCFYQRYLWDGSSLQPLGDVISAEAPIGECVRGQDGTTLGLGEG